MDVSQRDRRRRDKSSYEQNVIAARLVAVEREAISAAERLQAG